MKLFFNKIINLPILTVLFFLRGIFPFSTYVFLFYLLIFSLNFIVKKKISKHILVSFFQSIWLFLVIILFYIIGLFISNPFKIYLFKELGNVVLVLILAYYWFIHYKTDDKINSVLMLLSKFFLFAVLIISITGIVKLILELNGVYLSFFTYDLWLKTSSLAGDNNFFCLLIYFGLFLSGLKLASSAKKSQIFIYKVAILIFSTSIFLSGSRRGILILIALLILLILLQLARLFVKKLKNNIFLKRIKNISFLYMTIIFLAIVFIFFTSNNIKYVILGHNVNNIELKRAISSLTYEYLSMIKLDTEFKRIDTGIWEDSYAFAENKENTFQLNEFCSLIDPSQIIFPVNIDDTMNLNAGIIFNNKIKSEFSIDNITNEKIAYHIYRFHDFEVKKGTQYTINANCFVSEDSDLDIIDLRHTGKSFDDNYRAIYNHSMKSTWQNLELEFIPDRDTVLQLWLFVGKTGVNNLNEIQGYCEFTFPIIETENGIAPFQKMRSEIVYSFKRFFDLSYNQFLLLKANSKWENHKYNEAAYIYRRILIIDSNSKLAIERMSFLKANPDYITLQNNFAEEKEIKDTNNEHHFFLNSKLKNIIFSDKLKLSEKKIDNRTPINKNINVYGQRTERWKYAFNIFIKEYSLMQIFFGKGFSYQVQFSEQFLNTDQRVDYPHNPIISSFLYSGLFGGLFYIYFLVIGFIKYWVNRSKLALIGLLYLLTFAFAFFSGNSHFSVPAFTLLSLLPFAFRTKNKGKDFIELEKEEVPKNN